MGDHTPDPASNSDDAPHEAASAEARIIQDRRDKVAALRAAGVDPYPSRAHPTATIAAVRECHGELEAGADTDARYVLAGRMMSRRDLGKLAFADLRDRSGRLQLHVARGALGDDAYAAFGKLDLGDWIEVEGTAMCSRRGELSLKVERARLLAKCLRPLPEKFHGLQDPEARRARRHLDLVANPGSLELFTARSRAVSATRRFLEDRGFLEVETPILQPIYGGAAARPFTTHHNELGQTLYLRIAVELYLKRLMVGGMERVFEIGRNFRNEGVSFKHNPEFTMLELYQAWADYGDMMELFEQLVPAVARAVLGTASIEHPDHGTISLNGPWRRVTLRDAIRDGAGVDIGADDDGVLRRRLEADGHSTTRDPTRARLIDALLTHYVEPVLVQPTFLVDYPVELSPFARRHPEQPDVTERFECFIAGMEIANAFSELNDPADQRARLEDQHRAQQAGDETAEPVDEEFLAALEYGMPPTGGLGFGVDRLVMVLLGQRSIRDILLFPAHRTRPANTTD